MFTQKDIAQIEARGAKLQTIEEQIDRFCAISGLSRKQAFNEMMDMWERLVYIPWIEFIEKEEQRLKTHQAFKKQREKAEKGETPDMTMEEIDAIIAEVRTEHYAKTGGR